MLMGLIHGGESLCDPVDGSTVSNVTPVAHSSVILDLSGSRK